MNDAQKLRFEEDLELDFSFGIRGLARFRANVYMQQTCVGRRVPRRPVQDHPARRARPAAGRHRAVRPAARPRAGDRPDGLGQVDDAGVDDRPDQHQDARSHRHGRGSDRVPARAQELPGQPARDRPRLDQSFKRALKYILRQDPDVVLIGEMRDLETDRGGADDRRDRPPRVRHAAHQQRDPEHQPHHRRVPVAPAGSGARGAVVRARGRHHADADPEGARARAARSRAEVMVPERRDPQPDPRGQAAPDLLADADRPVEVRHADDEPVAVRPVPAEGDLARRVPRPLERARRAQDDDPRPAVARSALTARPANQTRR